MSLFKRILRVVTQPHRVLEWLAWQLSRTRYGQKIKAAGLLASDAFRYLRHACLGPARSTAELDVLIAIEAHRLEKAIVLRKDPARPITEAAYRLADHLERRLGHGEATWVVRMGVDALGAYLEENLHADRRLFERYRALRSAVPASDEPLGGSAPAPQEAGSHFDFAVFARSRRSIRHFTNRPVERETLLNALRVAQTAPSVCNRQTSRAYVVTDPVLRDAALALQNGNRGFILGGSVLLVVTTDVRGFAKPEERHQPWIDGGIYSLNLAYALHGEGLGVCYLNWAASLEKDRALRKLLKLPDWEVVITLMLAGYPDPAARCCLAARRDIGE